jgi:hypothetical protein
VALSWSFKIASSLVSVAMRIILFHGATFARRRLVLSITRIMMTVSDTRFVVRPMGALFGPVGKRHWMILHGAS